MATNDGGPAFPWHSDGMAEDYEPTQGMTLRDYFAACALRGFMAEHSQQFGLPAADAERASGDDETAFTSLAVDSYAMADAMLAARGKQ